MYVRSAIIHIHFGDKIAFLELVTALDQCQNTLLSLTLESDVNKRGQIQMKEIMKRSIGKRCEIKVWVVGSKGLFFPIKPTVRQ